MASTYCVGIIKFRLYHILRYLQVEYSVVLLTQPAMKGLNPLFKSRALLFQVLGEGKYQDFTSTLEADLARE